MMIKIMMIIAIMIIMIKMILIIAVVITNSLFQPGDFSTESTTDKFMLGVIFLHKS